MSPKPSYTLRFNGTAWYNILQRHSQLLSTPLSKLNSHALALLSTYTIPSTLRISVTFEGLFYGVGQFNGGPRGIPVTVGTLGMLAVRVIKEGDEQKGFQEFGEELADVDVAAEKAKWKDVYGGWGNEENGVNMEVARPRLKKDRRERGTASDSMGFKKRDENNLGKELKGMLMVRGTKEKEVEERDGGREEENNMLRMDLKGLLRKKGGEGDGD